MLPLLPIEKNLQAIAILPFLLALAVIAVLPSYHPLENLNWYDEKRIIELAVLATSAFTILFSSTLRRHLCHLIFSWPRWILWALLLIFLLGVVSSIFSYNPFFGLVEVGIFFLLLLFSLQIASIRSHHGDIIDSAIIGAFTLCALLYLIAFSASLYFLVSLDGLKTKAEIFTNFFNRRFLNQLQTATFPSLLIAPFFFSKSIKKFSWPLFLLPPFWWMLALISGGRGVLIATLTGIFLAGCLFPKYWKKWFAVSTFTLLTGSIGAFFMNAFINSFLIKAPAAQTITEEAGGVLEKIGKFSDRADLWKNSLLMIRESPLLGKGPMHFAHLHHPFGAHPHNFALQLLCEWGTLVAVLLFILCCYAFRKWFQKSSRLLKGQVPEQKSLLHMALTATMLAIAAHCLVSGNFVIPLSQLTIFLVFGWAMGIIQEKPQNSFADPGHSAEFTMAAGILLAILFITYGLFPEFIPFQKWINMQPRGSIIFPRFWSVGYF